MHPEHESKSTKLHLFAASLLGLPLGSALAQAPRPPQHKSPVVHPDRTVTFNFRAPNARKVELSAQFLKGNQPLTADTNGVWSITVGPVEPNLYPYNFVVDGVSVADPANQEFFPNERFKTSLVDIPGDQPSLYSIQEVPHGEVTLLLTTSRKSSVAPGRSSFTRHRAIVRARRGIRCSTSSAARLTRRKRGSGWAASTSFSTISSRRRRPCR